MGAPYLILCSEDDDLALCQIICNFAQRLQELGGDVKLVKWSNSPHVGSLLNLAILCEIKGMFQIKSPVSLSAFQDIINIPKLTVRCKFCLEPLMVMKISLRKCETWTLRDGGNTRSWQIAK